MSELHIIMTRDGLEHQIREYLHFAPIERHPKEFRPFRPLQKFVVCAACPDPVERLECKPGGSVEFLIAFQTL